MAQWLAKQTECLEALDLKHWIFLQLMPALEILGLVLWLQVSLTQLS